MNYQSESSVRKSPSFLLRLGLAALVLVTLITIDANGQAQPSVAGAPTHATHVLGLDNVKRNLSGELSINGEYLRFQRDGKASTQLNIASIQNISLGEQDKQVGGLPMTLGKAAVPFAGGRVVSLFSHKKYDSLVIEYSDSTGGFHSVIFRVAKGQAEPLKNALLATNAKLDRSETRTPVRPTSDVSLEPGTWSIQVDRVDPGTTTLDPCFADAIYENMVQDLKASKQFNDVFRANDRTAHDIPRLLVLKTIVETYSPGSETRRAVTTVAGATKLKVHIQLIAADGSVVLDRAVAGNVRFIGDNLRATHKIATNTSKLLKQSALLRPQP
jgi:hypothetical protein